MTISLVEETIFPWPEEMYKFLKDVWHRQGKVSNTCSGMASFSFWPERVLYDAAQDELVKWVLP